MAEKLQELERKVEDGRIDFLGRMTLRPRERNTVIVLDNASTHRSKLIKELRPVWESRELFLFYLAPYSSYYNIAETHIKWQVNASAKLRIHCLLFYVTDRALATVGTCLFVNHSHYTA